MSKELLEKQLQEQTQLIKQEREKLYKIQDELQVFENDELKEKYLGKYFKYSRNCYSCPKTEEDYWDIYYFVVNVVENGMLNTIRHEKTSDGEIKIGKELKHGMSFLDSKIIEVSKEEYKNAWKLIMDKITDLELIFYF